MRAQVDPGHPDFGKALLCKCQVDQFETHRRDVLREQSMLGPLSRHTFDTLRPEGRHGRDPQRYQAMVERAKQYVERPEGWLVIGGVPGCGKTHLAAAVANAVIDRGEPVLFLIVADLLDHLRATFGPNSDVRYDELFDQVSKAPLLVLDDLGGHSSSPWAQEKLFQLISRRYNAKLPTVITVSNAISELDSRLRVRLTDEDISTILVLEEPESPLFQRSGALSLELLREMRFDNFDAKRLDLDKEQRAALASAHARALDFADHPEGWLFFTGPCGSGKTHLAAAIANRRLESGQPVYFAVVPDLLDHLRATFMPDSRVTYDAMFETVRTAPLLILDDLGAHSNSTWAEEKLYQLANYRYNAKLPTIFTTNFRPDDLDPRLCSRLLDKQLSTPINLKVPDYRSDTQQQYPEPRRPAGRKR